MNPETKLTDEDIRGICERHGITYKSHERITTGFSHEVHRLNDDLVIKLFNKATNKNYLCEKSILSLNVDGMRKPRLVAFYDGSDDERAYIIMSYLNGTSLGKVWHKIPDTHRERLIEDISKTLRSFQSISLDVLDIPTPGTWDNYLQQKVEKILGRLKEKSIITEERSAEVVGVLKKARTYFADNEELHVLYWDIHFDNFIVDENYELLGIIDLENVRTLPIDYPLFVVCRQMEEPHKYLAEADEKYADKKDYQHLWGWYQKYYPEVFTPENLEERILTYQLLDELHLMIEWSHDAELRKSFQDKLSAFHNL